MNLLLVALGGALGALARYFITITIGSFTKFGFPLGTLVANVTGCFLVGWLIGSGAGEKSQELRLGFGVGFLGALTTFSTFSAETFQQAVDGQWGVATTIVLANVVLCMIAVYLGVIFGRKLSG